VEAGLLSLHWVVAGYGYEVTGREILDVVGYTMRAAEMGGVAAETRERIKELVTRDASDGIVCRVLAREYVGFASR